MDKTAEVTVVGVVTNKPHLSAQQMQVILEYLKQVYTAFLNVISFTRTKYHNTRLCMGTVLKIMYNFVSGHSNNCRPFRPFSIIFFLLKMLRSQIMGK
jgi:hypothetical protein